ncbi:MAG: type II toxin-antitoxin system death-on-curing family toxin [Thermoanaerobaculia bacterium]|nr:type II toxin-antitoxin system death-on-curing family toxin [Thermoanaerobaculia bacterium]
MSNAGSKAERKPKPSEPRWLTRAMVEQFHRNQIKLYGGLPGTRDASLLESALARPRQKLAYEPESDLATLAASLGAGLARNHPFVDGNKRISLVAMAVFLELNGLVLEAPEPETVITILALAAGEVTEVELADWIRRWTARS